MCVCVYSSFLWQRIPPFPWQTRAIALGPSQKNNKHGSCNRRRALPQSAIEFRTFPKDKHGSCRAVFQNFAAPPQFPWQSRAITVAIPTNMEAEERFFKFCSALLNFHVKGVQSQWPSPPKKSWKLKWQMRKTEGGTRIARVVLVKIGNRFHTNQT